MQSKNEKLNNIRNESRIIFTLKPTKIKQSKKIYSRKGQKKSDLSSFWHMICNIFNHEEIVYFGAVFNSIYIKIGAKSRMPSIRQGNRNRHF